MSNVDETKVTEAVKAEASKVSKSQQKRLDRKKKNAEAKRNDLVGAIIGVLAIVVILGAIIASIASNAAKQAKVITPSDDFSKLLTDTGMIKGVNVESITQLCDYNNIIVPLEKVATTDEEFEEEKESLLNSNLEYNEASEEAIADGTKINLDYVGSIDGVEFEGGNSNGEGYDLTIGSGSFIPGFEDALIGHKVGEVFDIDVTFPEEYQAEELAGKAAVFNCTINGIYEKAEFNDDFVKEHLSDKADTVEGYRAALDEENIPERTREFVENYIYDNSTVTKFPKKYLKQLKANQKYNDISTYEYMNQMMASMYGQGYSSFEQYTGLTEEAYDATLDVSSKQVEKEKILFQAIAQKEGITVSEDEVKAYVDEMFGEDGYDRQVEAFGKGYLAQMALDEKVIDILTEKATVQ